MTKVRIITGDPFEVETKMSDFTKELGDWEYQTLELNGKLCVIITYEEE